MTTRKKTAKVTKEVIEQPIDYEGHDVEVEVVKEPKLPQTYQATVFLKLGGDVEVVGHIEYSDSTGLTRTIPSPKYDSDLISFVDSGITVRGNPDAFFSPKTKGWIMNLHKAELPRNWAIEEVRSMNEV